VGKFKDKAYKTYLHTLEELRNDIHRVISTISGQELQRVKKSSAVVLENIWSRGWHFQHML